MSKYLLSHDKSAIIDINVSEFKDNTIIFPAEVDGHRISYVEIPGLSLMELKGKFGSFDVIIENGIECLEENMFCNSVISSISIPPSIENIPDSCFRYSSLQEISFDKGSNIKTIGASAFLNCLSLSFISLPPTLKTIKKEAFKNSGLEEIAFPETDNQLVIEDLAFANCYSLKKVTFPPIKVSLGKNSFCFCGALEKVEMEKIITEVIPEGIFCDCPSLEHIILPETVNVIEKRAFYDCRHLKTVGLQQTQVSKIMDSAFEYCIGYSDGNLPRNIKSIGNQAFMCCNISNLSIPLFTLEEIGNQAFFENPLSEGMSLLPFIFCQTIGDNIFAGSKIKRINLFPFSGTNVSCKFMFSGCICLEEVTMEANSQIYEGMFSGCDNLKQVFLSDNVTIIPDYSFLKCISLKHIKLPKSITEIGVSAFRAAGLEDLDLGNSSKVNISSNAFIFTNIGEVKLPTYNCTICYDSFDEDLMATICEESPFCNITEKVDKTTV